MTCLNSRVFWNRMTFEANLVFTCVLSFHGGTPTPKHVLCHYCCLLPLFSIQAIIFCNMDRVSLIEIELKPSLTFESSVEYWQHLDMAWGQQDPTNDANNPNTSQDTTKVNAEVNEKITLFIFDICKTQTLSPCFASTSFTYKTMAFTDVFIILKNPMVT